MRTKTKLSGIILFLTITNVAVTHAAVPKIEKNKVIFDNGVNMTLHTRQTVFEDPNAALQAGMPLSYTEKPLLLQTWKRLLIVRKNFYFEGSDTEIENLDYSGMAAFPTLGFTGRLIILEKAKRLFLVGISAHVMTDRTFILDPKGKLINTVKHGEIFDVAPSADDQLVWFYKADVENGKPLTTVVVVNRDGDRVDQEKTFEATTLNIKYEGKHYYIKVPEPDFPG